MIYAKIGSTSYAATITGKVSNRDWDNRDSKAIPLPITYAEAAAMFHDDAPWSIVEEHEQAVIDETTGEPTGETETVSTEYDNSGYSVLGDITVHTDGTCTVWMGKPTDEENLLILLYGGAS